jgi:hypothetical protein
LEREAEYEIALGATAVARKLGEPSATDTGIDRAEDSRPVNAKFVGDRL